MSDKKDKKEKKHRHHSSDEDSKGKEKEKVNEKEEKKEKEKKKPAPPKKMSLHGSKCPIDFITVYRDRAEVVRQVSLSQEQLCEGVSTPGDDGFDIDLSITGLTHSLDRNSVHVSGGTGAAVILEVATLATYEQSPTVVGTTEAQLKEKQDLRVQLSKERAKLVRTSGIVDQSIAWVTNWATSVQSTPASQAQKPNDTDFLSPKYLANVKGFMDFYAQEMERLKENKAEIEEKVVQVDKKIYAVDQEIRTMSTSSTTAREHKCTVIISLHVSGTGPISLHLAYVVPNASWYPKYNCRVDSANSSVQFTYFAVLKNGTGEDWVESQMSLSTAAPDVRGAPPELRILKVNQRVNRPAVTRVELKKKAKRDASRERSCSESSSGGSGSEVDDRDFAISEKKKEGGGGAAPPPAVATLVTKASESMASTTFSIPRQVTIMSDGQEHQVTIAVLTLDTAFSYAVVPAVTPYSYLKCTTTNKSPYFLLEGEASVFMDNNFVATSPLKDVSPDEDFVFFLGPDKSVKVEYKAPQDVSDQQGGVFTKNKNLQTWTSQVTVKNNKAKKIAVTIYEQIPLSSDARIIVNLVEPDLKKMADVVKLNNNKNVLEWKYKIDAGKNVTMPLKYTVEWPKDVEVDYEELVK